MEAPSQPNEQPNEPSTGRQNQNLSPAVQQVKSVIKEKNLAPVIIAFLVAALAAAYYVISGSGSLDLSSRKLANTQNVEKVDTANPQNIQVKCKNGQSYEILFKPGQSNYNDLIFNACGSEGTQE